MGVVIDLARITTVDAHRRWVREGDRRAAARALPIGDPVVDGSPNGEAEDDWTTLCLLHRGVDEPTAAVLRIRYLCAGAYVCGTCGHSLWAHGAQAPVTLTAVDVAALVAAHRYGCMLCGDACQGFDTPIAREPSDAQIGAVLGMLRRDVRAALVRASSAVDDNLWRLRRREP